MAIEVPSSSSARRLPVLPPREPIGGRARGVWRVGLISLVAIAALGCAAGSGPMHARANDRVVAPMGPGHVFASAEDAALDALAYSHLASRRSERAAGLARGGTVRAVAGGFRYDEPVTAPVGEKRLRYRLGREDVLHYRHYPRSSRGQSELGAGGLAQRDRRVVDRRDPLGRPVYFMTPGRVVQVYAGRAEGTRTIGRVRAGVRPQDESIRLALRRAPPQARPLALQPPLYKPLGR